MVQVRMIKVLLAVCAAWLIISGPAGATRDDRGVKRTKGSRVALVMGNGAYDSSPLKNPVNDANDIAVTLENLGFKVIKGTNLNKKKMLKHLSKFSNSLKGADVGLFYFAGHGAQLDNRNYLIPVGNTVEDEIDIEYEGLDAGRVISRMEKAGSRLNIVILDACRNNPFKRSFRSSAQGLARMDAPKGTIIAYATGPGSVAADGRGRNGTYTSHLLSALKTPGLDIQNMFNRAGMGVMKETGDKQMPWTSTTPIPLYYLAGPPDQGKREPPEPIKNNITVKPSPPDSLVRILNIAPKYRDGIELKPGRYHIEVSAEGYERHREWVTLGAGQALVLSVDLEKTKAAARIETSYNRVEKKADEKSEICRLLAEKIKYTEAIYEYLVQCDEYLEALVNDETPKMEADEIVKEKGDMERSKKAIDDIDRQLEKYDDFSEIAKDCYNHSILKRLQQSAEAKLEALEIKQKKFEALAEKEKKDRGMEPSKPYSYGGREGNDKKILGTWEYTAQRGPMIQYERITYRPNHTFTGQVVFIALGNEIVTEVSGSWIIENNILKARVEYSSNFVAVPPGETVVSRIIEITKDKKVVISSNGNRETYHRIDSSKPFPDFRSMSQGGNSPSMGNFCCDFFGNKYCNVNPLPVGSPCFCYGQGEGIVCQ